MEFKGFDSYIGEFENESFKEQNSNSIECLKGWFGQIYISETEIFCSCYPDAMKLVYIFHYSFNEMKRIYENPELFRDIDTSKITKISRQNFISNSGRIPIDRTISGNYIAIPCFESSSKLVLGEPRADDAFHIQGKVKIYINFYRLKEKAKRYIRIENSNLYLFQVSIPDLNEGRKNEILSNLRYKINDSVKNPGLSLNQTEFKLQLSDLEKQQITFKVKGMDDNIPLKESYSGKKDIRIKEKGNKELPKKKSEHYPIKCPYCFEVFSHQQRYFRVNPSQKAIDSFREYKKTHMNADDDNSYNSEFDENDLSFYFNMDEKFDETNDIDPGLIENKVIKCYSIRELKQEKDNKVVKIKNQYVSHIVDKYGKVTNIDVCKRCKRRLPNNSGLMPMMFMPIIGITNSGKTAYILTMERILQSKRNVTLSNNIATLIEETRIGTDLNSNIQPIYWEFEQNDYLGTSAGIVVTYNLPGEGLTQQEYINRNIKYFDNADAFMLVIAPHQIHGLNIAPPIRQKDEYKDVIPTLNELLLALDSVRKVKSQRIALVLTMLDRISAYWLGDKMLIKGDEETLKKILDDRSINTDSLIKKTRSIYQFLSNQMTGMTGQDEGLKKIWLGAKTTCYATQVGPQINGFTFFPFGVLDPIYWLLGLNQEGQ